MKNRNKIITTILLGLGLLALPQGTRAVSPAPDGGYPGGNTAEGQSALLRLTTGTYNTAIGYLSLLSLEDGSFNTATGAGTLLANTGSENTAMGVGALLSNTIGSGNTANGGFALFSNTGGGANTAIGDEALLDNTAGNDNTASGRQALLSNTTGNSNTAVGESCLFNNIDGGANTAVGVNALQNNNHGGNNTAIGVNALGGNDTGSHNIGLGDGAGVNVTSASHVICIGADGNNVDNACYIGQIFNAASSGGSAVFINSNGRLGTMTSSRRFKENIEPMEQASEALFALKPVTFRYNKDLDPVRTSQFGLVAEEVEKVNPDLVVRDKEGKAYSVRYEQINAMLLNEFLKEHKAFLEQQRKVGQQETTVAQQSKDFQATIARLEGVVAQQQKEIQILTAGFTQQTAQIQKVSAQMEESKAGPAVVATGLLRREVTKTFQ